MTEKEKIITWKMYGVAYIASFVGVLFYFKLGASIGALITSAIVALPAALAICVAYNIFKY